MKVWSLAALHLGYSCSRISKLGCRWCPMSIPWASAQGFGFPFNWPHQQERKGCLVNTCYVPRAPLGPATQGETEQTAPARLEGTVCY